MKYLRAICETLLRILEELKELRYLLGVLSGVPDDLTDIQHKLVELTEIRCQLEDLNNTAREPDEKETESARAERLYMEGISNVLNYRGRINERE